MCVCMRECVCMCECVCESVCECVSVCVCLGELVCVCMHECVCECVCVCVTGEDMTVVALLDDILREGRSVTNDCSSFLPTCYVVCV